VDARAERRPIVRTHDRERLQLIEQIKTLAALIEQAQNSAQITKYIEELNELKTKLVGLRAPGQQP
jgi:hypothetical protein